MGERKNKGFTGQGERVGEEDIWQETHPIFAEQPEEKGIFFFSPFLQSMAGERKRAVYAEEELFHGAYKKRTIINCS